MAKNLKALAAELAKKLGSSEDKDKVIVYSPIKLDKADMKKISEFISSKYSIDADLENKIDESTIAGIKIAYKDLLLDYSLKGKLNRLAKQIS